MRTTQILTVKEHYTRRASSQLPLSCQLNVTDLLRTS